MDIKILDRPAFVATGIIVEGYWDALPSIVPAAWRTLFSKMGANEGDEPLSDYVEISFDRHSNLFREMVSIVRPGSQAVAPEGMRRIIVPANRYLHVSHEGPLSGISSSFEAIYDHASRSGIAVTNFKLDFGYDVEFSSRTHELFVGVAPFDQPQFLESDQIAEV